MFRKLKELTEVSEASRRDFWLGLVAQRETNPQIAWGLNHSVATAKLDVRRVVAKLGASDRHEAATKAVEIGLIAPR